MLAGEADFEVVGEATSGAEGVTLTERERPDVVLMDLQMPGVDGATATAEITERFPETRVLVLTPWWWPPGWCTACASAPRRR
jgi:DNA-binding NarL/FixJ family response regulator